MLPLLFSLVLTASTVLRSVAGVQTPLVQPLPSLQSLTHGSYSKFTHEAFPQHSLRIKKTDFCDSTVNAYSGYIDIVSGGAKHLFFYFFESRRDPSTDPVVMWINGGPGGSSAIGLLMELGPCNIDLKGNGTVWNPYGWNDQANLFFLDQPVGVGYSYAEDPTNHVYSSPQAAKDVDTFIRLFFETFSQFKGRDFHIAGESYGGRYIPVFASEVIDANVRAKKDGRELVNLKSVLIGNGFTSPHKVYFNGPKMLCTSASGHPPVGSISQCVEWNTKLPYCKKMIKEGCQDRFDAIQCRAATDFCAQLWMDPVRDMGLNPYDLRKECLPKGSDICYEENVKIIALLNNNATRELLGVDKAVGPWNSQSPIVAKDFQIDWMIESTHYLSQLLERGVKTLIYVGMTDAACSWLAENNTVNELEWTGADDFVPLPMKTWSANVSSFGGAKKDGSIKSARGLTFLTIAEAGHMVPLDQPEVALAMLNGWLDGKL